MTYLEEKVKRLLDKFYPICTKTKFRLWAYVNEFPGLSISQIGRKLCIFQPRVSIIISRLEKEGYVRTEGRVINNNFSKVVFPLHTKLYELLTEWAMVKKK